jgi:hypothetical protein
MNWIHSLLFGKNAAEICDSPQSGPTRPMVVAALSAQSSVDERARAWRGAAMSFREGEDVVAHEAAVELLGSHIQEAARAMKLRTTADVSPRR